MRRRHPAHVSLDGTQLGRPRSRDESTSPPISMLGYATTLS